MVGKSRQGIVHKFDAAAIEKSAVGRGRHEHRPAAMIRYADDAAALRHSGASCGGEKSVTSLEAEFGTARQGKRRGG